MIMAQHTLLCTSIPPWEGGGEGRGRSDEGSHEDQPSTVHSILCESICIKQFVSGLKIATLIRADSIHCRNVVVRLMLNLIHIILGASRCIIAWLWSKCLTSLNVHWVI